MIIIIIISEILFGIQTCFFCFFFGLDFGRVKFSNKKKNIKIKKLKKLKKN